MWSHELPQEKPEKSSWVRQIGPAAIWVSFLVVMSVAVMIAFGALAASVIRYNDAMRYDRTHSSDYRSAHTYQAGR